MALTGDFDPAKLRSAMGKEGWQLVIVNSADQLYANAARPACFAVFIGERFHSDSVSLIRRGKAISRASWMLVVQKASNQLNLRALDAGALGILNEPVNPSQILLRARQMWERFSKEHGTNLAALLPLVSPDKIPRVSQQIGSSPSGKGSSVMESTGSLEKLGRDELVAELRRRMQALDTRGGFRKGKWRQDLLDTLIPNDPAQAVKALNGLDGTRAAVRDMLKYVAEQIAAGRILLVSIRCDNTRAVDFPEHVVTLMSSDPTIPANAYIKSALLPGIQIAFERKAPVVLKTPLPAIIDGEKRPAFLNLKNKVEVAHAVLPLHLTHEDIYAALLVQFDRVPEPLTIKMLEEAMSYLTIPSHAYLKIDFLSRFYRKLKGGK